MNCAMTNTLLKKQMDTKTISLDEIMETIRTYLKELEEDI